MKLLKKDTNISDPKSKKLSFQKFKKKLSSENNNYNRTTDHVDEIERIKKTNNIFLSLIYEDHKSLNTEEKANNLNTKYKQISLYFNQDAFNTLLQGIIAFCSILVSLFDYLWAYENEEEVKLRASKLSSSFCLIFTVLLLSSIVFEFLIKSKLVSMVYSIPEWVFRSDWKFCLDYLLPIVITLFHPTPFTINTKIQLKTTREVGYAEYRLNDIFACLLMFRLFFIFKAYVFYSKYYTPRTSRISKMYGTSINFNYFVKSISKDQSFITYAILFLLVWIFGTFGLIVSESPLQFQFNESNFFNFYNIWNSIWCTFITIMTIGYGDFYPVTSFGRIIMVVSVLGGLVLLSTLVSTLNSVLNMDDDELAVTNILNTILMNEETTKRSKNLIIEFAIIKKMIDEYKKNKNVDREVAIRKMNDLKDLRKKIILSKFELKSAHRDVEELAKSQEIEDNGFEYKTNQLSEQLDTLKDKISLMMQRINGINRISSKTINLDNIKKKLKFLVTSEVSNDRKNSNENDDKVSDDKNYDKHDNHISNENIENKFEDLLNNQNKEKIQDLDNIEENMSRLKNIFGDEVKTEDKN